MIELSFITRDSLNPNQPCGGKTTKQKGFTLWILFVFGLTPSLRLQRWVTTGTSRYPTMTLSIIKLMLESLSIPSKDGWICQIFCFILPELKQWTARCYRQLAPMLSSKMRCPSHPRPTPSQYLLQKSLLSHAITLDISQRILQVALDRWHIIL